MLSPPPSSSSEHVRRWGGGDVWIAMAIGLFSSSLFGLAYQAVAGVPKDGESSLVPTMLSFLGLWVGWFGWPVVASLTKGARSLALDYGLSFQWKDLPLGVAVSVSGTFLTFFIYLPVQILAPDIAEQVSDPAESLSNLASGFWVIPLYLAICLGAPFVEELFFRGLALRAFSYRFGATAGIIGSSVLFGVIHLEPLQTPALIGFGIILAVVAHKTGRLGPSVIGHCLFNTTSLTLLSFQ